MPSPDFERASSPENDTNEKSFEIHEILRDRYGLRPDNVEKWFHTATGLLEEESTFGLKIVSKHLSSSPLFLDLAMSVERHSDDDQLELRDTIGFIELIRQMSEEKISEADVPIDDKNRLLAELPKRVAALEETMRRFPTRKWKNKDEYLDALRAQQKHIQIWMTLLTKYEPMLVLQITDTSGPSPVADFRGVISRSYYWPEQPLFIGLVNWIQQVRELAGKNRSEELDWIIKSRAEEY